MPITKDDLEKLKFLSTHNYSFRVVEWTLNGIKSPVSNSYGSLQPNGNAASYTAPSNIPDPDVVTISVKLDLGGPSAFYLVSNLTIVENDLFLKVVFKGNTYIYYQYGFDETEVMPDPNNFSIVYCGLSENRLQLAGLTYISDVVSDQVEIFLDNPWAGGSRGMIGLEDGGNDKFDFAVLNPFAYYDMTDITRKRLEDNSCTFDKNVSNHVTFTLAKFWVSYFLRSRDHSAAHYILKTQAMISIVKALLLFRSREVFILNWLHGIDRVKIMWLKFL